MLVQLIKDANRRILEQYVVLAAAWGITRPTNRVRWKAIIGLYQKDLLAESLELVSDTDIGDLGEFADAQQIIGAEAQTSVDSIITRINEWLEVEHIPDQYGGAVEEVGQSAVAAITTICSRIGMRVGSPVLITLLSTNVVLPDNLQFAGYVSIKEPYAKFCIPDPALDQTAFNLQVQRLAAIHAASIISSSGAPAWLLASSQALTDVEISNEIRYAFCTGAHKWLDPSLLDMRLRGLHMDENRPSTVDANQAILVGRHLIDRNKIKAFRDCLAYHSPTSVIHFWAHLFSNDPTRDACKKYFGFAPEYLFEQALASTCK